MSALPWCRLYTEFASDPKIQILAFEDQRHYVMLLCLKGNGVLDAQAPNPAYHERLVAKALGLDPIAANEAKRRLIEVGLINSDWSPSSWDKRQFTSDSSTARVHKFRAKIDRNVSETFQKRRCNGTDTEQIQNRTDTEKKKTVAAAPKVSRGKKSPKIPIPPDFALTPELATYVSKTLPLADPLALFEKFCDQARAKAWEYADWSAGLRFYCRNARDDSGHFGAGQYPKKSNGTGGIRWA